MGSASAYAYKLIQEVGHAAFRRVPSLTFPSATSHGMSEASKKRGLVIASPRQAGGCAKRDRRLGQEERRRRGSVGGRSKKAQTFRSRGDLAFRSGEIAKATFTREKHCWREGD